MKNDRKWRYAMTARWRFGLTMGLGAAGAYAVGLAVEPHVGLFWAVSLVLGIEFATFYLGWLWAQVNR